MASALPTSGLEGEVVRILRQEADAVSKLAQRADIAAVEQVVDLLSTTTGRVFVTGCGTSGAAAKKIAHTLSCVGCAASYVNPADAPHGGLGVMRENDVAILISKGGGTHELTQLVPSLVQMGVRIIAIAGVPDPLIGVHADAVLEVRVDAEPDPFNMLATASTLSVIALMDAIAIVVMQRTGFSRENFAVIHPSGAVGERLTRPADRDDVPRPSHSERTPS